MNRNVDVSRATGLSPRGKDRHRLQNHGIPACFENEQSGRNIMLSRRQGCALNHKRRDLPS